MAFDAIYSGFPSQSPYPAGAATHAEALDTNSGATWNNPGSGWAPDSNAFAKSAVLGTTAAQASLLVITVPVTGIYQINAVAVQATGTNGTPPQFQIAYTEGDTGTAFATANLGSTTATTGIGQNNQANIVLNLKGGSTLTVSSLAPTTLTANVKVRVSYLG